MLGFIEVGPVDQTNADEGDDVIPRIVQRLTERGSAAGRLLVRQLLTAGGGGSPSGKRTRAVSQGSTPDNWTVLLGLTYRGPTWVSAGTKDRRARAC